MDTIPDDTIVYMHAAAMWMIGIFFSAFIFHILCETYVDANHMRWIREGRVKMPMKMRIIPSCAYTDYFVLQWKCGLFWFDLDGVYSSRKEAEFFCSLGKPRGGVA